MNYLRRKWIVHGRMLKVCFCIAAMIGFISFVCGALIGYEQGQFSVISGKVTCIIPPGEFVCEENKHEHN